MAKKMKKSMIRDSKEMLLGGLVFILMLIFVHNVNGFLSFLIGLLSLIFFIGVLDFNSNLVTSFKKNAHTRTLNLMRDLHSEQKMLLDSKITGWALLSSVVLVWLSIFVSFAFIFDFVIGVLVFCILNFINLMHNTYKYQITLKKDQK